MKKYWYSALIAAMTLTSGCEPVADTLQDHQASIVQQSEADSVPTPDSNSDPASEAPDSGPADNAVVPPDATSSGGNAVIPGISPPPADDPEPVIRPEAPRELRAIRYSNNTGELFWAAPADADQATTYLVESDGMVLNNVSTLSFFADALAPGVAHSMSVYAVDAKGIRSVPARIDFNAEIDVPPPIYEFDLAIDRPHAALEEGNRDGTAFSISVAPKGRETVQITVQPLQTGDGDNVVVELGKSVLDRDDPNTTVIFKFPIGMQPVFPHSRSFEVLAVSGEEVRSAEIELDVKPTMAPDVYLLIGQSNMVGSSEAGAKNISPGGTDERNDRIWQLNVAPNNNRIFNVREDFLNESNNAIEPRFILAEDPLHDPRDPIVSVKGGSSVGPGLSFAKAALAGTTQRIYLVPAAWGATGFCKIVRPELAWNADIPDNASLGGTELLDRALVRLRMTLRDTGGVLRAILWHQGGADSNSQACADSYARNLQLMVERLRRDAEPDLRGSDGRGSNAAIPFIVATQSKGSDGRGDFSRWSSTKQQVDSVQRNISGLLPFADWVNNDDLVPPAYPCGSSSCVHFGATANREIGRRFYQALERIWSRGE